MRKMKNKKLKATLSITGYLLLLIALCFVGVFVFHSYYYESVYVSGASMYPTLNGEENEHTGTVVDFGIVDAHKSAIDHIKRFDIVSTYFPYTSKYKYDYTEDGVLKPTATKKIKRVIALPNETFRIEQGVLKIIKGEAVEVVEYTFKTNYGDDITVKDTKEDITLKDNEYWLLGDNRSNSTDCGSTWLNVPVKKENIQGVLVAIEGQAKLKAVAYACEYCGKQHKKIPSNGKCANPKCGQIVSEWKTVYGLKDKQYHWPKFF